MPQRRRYVLLALVLSAAALATHAGVPPNLSSAVDAQQALADERPDDPAVHNDLGNLLLLAGRDDAAETAYERALEIDETLVSARFNLGLLLARRGKDGAALRQLRAVVKTEPAHSWAWFELGAIHERRGSRAAAIESYARAYALNPDLSFPETNPQVIDSKLLTEALLVAFERWPRSPRPPQDYENPDRIAGLLQPLPEELAADADAPVEPGDGAPDTATEAAAAARQRFEDAMSAGAGGGTGQVVGGSAKGSPTGGVRDVSGTTIRSYDPQTGTIVDEEPGAAEVEESAGQPSRDRFRSAPGRVLTPGGTYGQPGQAGEDGDGGTILVPSPASTGRLEMRLVPRSGRRDRVARAGHPGGRG